MKPERGLGVLGVCVVITAWLPLQSGANEVQQPVQRITAKGFSFAPPSEARWQTSRVSDSWIRLGKFGDGPDETIFIDARLVRLPRFSTSDEFRGIVGEGAVAYTDKARFKTLRSEVSLDSSRTALCVRSYGVVEDHAAQRKSGMTGVMIIEQAALNCAYPGVPEIGVSFVYSHRYGPGGADPHFLDKANELFRTMQFGPL
jgi:hypothetical protein